MNCPVCVYHATNVSPEQLRGMECFNCGAPLDEHQIKVSTLAPPGMAYQIDVEACRRLP